MRKTNCGVRKAGGERRPRIVRDAKSRGGPVLLSPDSNTEFILSSHPSVTNERPPAIMRLTYPATELALVFFIAARQTGLRCGPAGPVNAAQEGTVARITLDNVYFPHRSTRDRLENIEWPADAWRTSL